MLQNSNLTIHKVTNFTMMRLHNFETCLLDKIGYHNYWLFSYSIRAYKSKIELQPKPLKDVHKNKVLLLDKRFFAGHEIPPELCCKHL